MSLSKNKQYARFGANHFIGNLWTSTPEYSTAIIGTFVGLLLGLLATSGAAEPLPCETRSVVVQGSSMSPRIRDGETIAVVSGGAHCAEPITRGEVVVLMTNSNKLPLIKALRGMPGDLLAVKDGKIMINGLAAMNTEGVVYRLPKARAAMIELYAHDYKGAIPPDTFLVMGENPAGSSDSSAFGLVAREHIIGKIID